MSSKPSGPNSNPKQFHGDQKVPLWLVPAPAIHELAWVMKHGADKYGPYNWRRTGVYLHTYISAAKRHLDAMQENELSDPESGLQHAAHAMACMAIVIDALKSGVLDVSTMEQTAWEPQIRERENDYDTSPEHRFHDEEEIEDDGYITVKRTTRS